MNNEETKCSSDEESARSTENSTEIDLCTVDEILEEIGFGRWQFGMLTVLASGIIADGAAIALLSFLAPCAGASWELSSLQVSTLAGAMFIGEFFGGLTWGSAADFYGRKKTYIYALLVQSSFGMLACISPNYSILVLCQVMIGFGVAVVSVPYDLIAESIPIHSRDTVLPMTNVLWGIGTCGVVCLAWATLPGLGWRWLVFFTTLPALLALAGTLYLDMSPRWLLGQGREEEARKILLKAAQQNGVQLHPFKLARIIPEGPPGCEADSALNMIFGPDLLIPSLVLILLYPLSSIIYTGGVVLGTLIFQKPEVDDSYVCSFNYGDILIGATPEIISAFVITICSRCLGRRPIVSLFTFTCCFALMVLRSIDKNVFPLSLSVAFVRGCISIAYTTMWMATPEIYPTPVRGTSHALLYGLSRVGSFFAPYLLYSFPLKFSCFALAVFCLMWSLGIWLLPETAGKALDMMCCTTVDISKHGERERLLRDESMTDLSHDLPTRDRLLRDESTIDLSHDLPTSWG